MVDIEKKEGGACERWMNGRRDFMFFSSVFQSYQDNGRMIMKQEVGRK